MLSLPSNVGVPLFVRMVVLLNGGGVMRCAVPCLVLPPSSSWCSSCVALFPLVLFCSSSCCVLRVEEAR
nr:MAG TPA: hypothetical protein [Caudoviricetes sp.]